MTRALKCKNGGIFMKKRSATVLLCFFLLAAFFSVAFTGCFLQNPLGLKDYEITVYNDVDGSKNKNGFEEVFYWEQPYTVKIKVEPNDVDVYWLCKGPANAKFLYDRATESLNRKREVDMAFNGTGECIVDISCYNSNSTYLWKFIVYNTQITVTVLDADTQEVIPKASIGFTNRESSDYVESDGSLTVDWYGMDYSGDMIVKAPGYETVTVSLSEYEELKLKETTLDTICLHRTAE